MKHTLHLEGMFFRESYGFLYYWAMVSERNRIVKVTRDFLDQT
jgi:hypothetical protein